MGCVYWFLKKAVQTVTKYIFTTQIRYWLRWLRCFARLHKKTQSLITTLATLIYMKNSFIYADFADFQYQMRNDFTINYVD